MLLNSAEFHLFRNNDTAKLEFCDGMNLIYGDNGAGKTNVLEAIFFFAAGKSFRNCKEREMIRFGENECRIGIKFQNRNGQSELAVKLSKKEKKRIYRNGIEMTRLSGYFGQFRSVIFSPDHLNLVKGGPEFRRRYLDIAICQSYPVYLGELSEFNRILLQKNAMLRKISDESLLDIYNEKLAETSARITLRRRDYFEKIMPFAKNVYDEMATKKESFECEYHSQASGSTYDELKNSYFELYSSKKENEKERGFTLYGAHKDDFVININSKDARSYGSQGQQRSSVLALKLAEGEMSKKITGEYPIFLLDDVLSELDDSRKEFVLGKLKGKQVIITDCSKNTSQYNCNNKIYVENGKYQKILN